MNQNRQPTAAAYPEKKGGAMKKIIFFLLLLIFFMFSEFAGEKARAGMADNQDPHRQGADFPANRHPAGSK
jgi:hypothetical protein